MSEQNLAQPVQKSSVKRLGIFSLIGAILVFIPVMAFFPRVLAWYFEPPVQTGCSCSESIAWALNVNRWVQLAGLIFGALIGAIIALKFRKIK
jgi:membrane associated rhomboid family serine protease